MTLNGFFPRKPKNPQELSISKNPCQGRLEIIASLESYIYEHPGQQPWVGINLYTVITGLSRAKIEEYYKIAMKRLELEDKNQ